MRAARLFIAVTLTAISGIFLFTSVAFAAPDLFKEGVNLLEKHQYSQAVTTFDKVLSTEPTNTAAYFNRGLAYAGLKQCDRAIDDLSAGISLDSLDARAYALRAVEYAKVRRDSLAVQDCNSSLKLNPNSAVPYYVRGLLNVYHSLNDPKVNPVSNGNSYSLNAGIDDLIKGICLEPAPICLFIGVTLSVAAGIVLLWLRVLLGPFAEVLHMHEISKGTKTRPFSTLFHVQDGERDWKSIIRWWEVRRFSYNFCVGLAGLASLAMILAVQKVTGLILLSAVFGVFCFGFAANLCYTFGWTGELVAQRIWGRKAQYFGPLAFSLGMIFSLGLTLVPGAISVCYPSFAQWLIG
jgi:hypothetical protein